MCGRYLFVPDDYHIIAKKIKQAIEHDPFYASWHEGEIVPSEYAPILYRENRKTTAKLTVWGYPPYSGSRLIINARSETVTEKPMFRASFKKNRCVVPATGFFEWQKSTGAKYLFDLPNRGMLYMAGLYDTFEHENRFVILTAQANASVSEVHHRMPMIFTEENCRLWLDTEEGAKKLLSAPLPELISSVCEN